MKIAIGANRNDLLHCRRRHCRHRQAAIQIVRVTRHMLNK